jgi:predicted nucleic acid-binding protein
MAAVLIDTNVFVYAHDRGEPVKQKRAIEVLDALQRSSNGHLSTQILAEFFNATTRGTKPILSATVASSQVEALAQAWPVLFVTIPIITVAARAVRDRRLNYWDAQLWATALLNQVPVIFSEDFASGSSLEGVRIINPFESKFVLEDWA